MGTKILAHALYEEILENFYFDSGELGVVMRSLYAHGIVRYWKALLCVNGQLTKNLLCLPNLPNSNINRPDRIKGTVTELS
jgi:hypothetical protein